MGEGCFSLTLSIPLCMFVLVMMDNIGVQYSVLIIHVCDGHVCSCLCSYSDVILSTKGTYTYICVHTNIH